jgi:tetratricopeptide (TPR) repeat protein
MQIWVQALLALLCGGIIGGLIAGQRDCSKHKIRLPITGNELELGILGDILIGAGACLATFGIAVQSHLFVLPQTDDDYRFIKLIAVGIITGFAGIQLLSGISSRLVRDVEDVKESVKSLELREASMRQSRRADSLRENGRYDEAEREYREALRLDPDNDTAAIGLAKVLRWTSRTDQAIQLLTEFIGRKPTASRAIYNRACYKALLNRRREAIADLTRAIQLDPYYRQYAQKDQDLDNLQGELDFPRLPPGPQTLSRNSGQLHEYQEETRENG